MSLSSINTDVCIVGGGSVGALLALHLAHTTNLSVHLIEQQSYDDVCADPRHIALAASTVDTMTQLGIDCATLGYPIKQIHVSDTGYLGQCRLQASELNVPALGYVVSLSTLTRQLHLQLGDHPQVIVHYQNRIASHEHSNGHHHIASDTQQWVSQYCVVAAGNSQTMPWLLETETQKDYGQYGVVANIKVAGNGPQRYRHTTAFERFTHTGPLAMLPIEDDTYNMLWSMTQDQAKAFVAHSSATQCRLVQEAFGTRLGRFTQMDSPVIFPLRLTQQQSLHQGIIVLGNASQTLHPIAGQGFNLAHRDVIALVRLLADKHPPLDIAETYRKARARDRQSTIQATDWLLHSFSHELLPFILPRNLGLLAMQKSRWLRRWFARLAMGYR